MSPKTRALLLSVVLLAALLAPACRSEVPPTPSVSPEVILEEDPVTEPSDKQPALLFHTTFEDETVHSVAFSPDGEVVAAGSYMQAQLWRVGDGTLADVIEYEHTVDDLAFSPDGSLLGAGQGVYGVRLMRVADGVEHHRLHGGYDNRLAFAPDGETVATGNRNGLVWLWRIEDGEQLSEFEPPVGEHIRSLAFSPDGELVAAGHWNGTVYLWRVRDGQLLHTLPQQTDYCHANDLAFSPDGQFLAVAGGRHELDDVVRLWRVADGSPHQELPLAREGRAVAFSPDGRWLAAGSTEVLSLWEMPGGTLRHTFDHVAEASDWITSLDFSPDSTLLAAGRWAGVLEVWQLAP